MPDNLSQHARNLLGWSKKLGSHENGLAVAGFGDRAAVAELERHGLVKFEGESTESAYSGVIRPTDRGKA
jgi:hypothetical protein